MLKRYNVDLKINESEEFKNDKLKEATDAVLKLGYSDEIDEERTGIYTYDDGWSVCKVYCKVPEGKNPLFIYSYPDKKVLNPNDPVTCANKSKGMNGYFVVERREGVGVKMERAWNFLDHNGITFDPWYDYINSNAFDSEGYHIAITYDESDNGYPEGANLVNKDGYTRFENNVGDIEICGEYFVIDESTKNVYDKGGKIRLEDVSMFKDIEYTYYDEDESSCDAVVYEVEFDNGNHCLYDASLNLLTECVEDVYDLTHTSGEADFYIVESTDRKKNILAPDGKLMFGNDPKTTSYWVEEIEEHPGYNDGHMNLVERLDQYAIIDNVQLKPINDIWYDEVKFFELEMMDNKGVAAVNLDGKCNIMYTDYEDSDYRTFMFKEPVDDIKMYEQFLVITKGDQDYVVWKDSRLLSIKCDHIYKTQDSYTFVVMVDNKFDLINTGYEKTFCEMYMGGKLFDACYDIYSYYPLMEYQGKVMFVDAEMFRPQFCTDGIGGEDIRWFDDAEIFDDSNNDTIFEVVENGQKKIIDEWGDDYEDDEEQ